MCALPPRPSWCTPNPDMSTQTQGINNKIDRKTLAFVWANFPPSPLLHGFITSGGQNAFLEDKNNPVTTRRSVTVAKGEDYQITFLEKRFLRKLCFDMSICLTRIHRPRNSGKRHQKCFCTRAISNCGVLTTVTHADVRGDTDADCYQTFISENWWISWGLKSIDKIRTEPTGWANCSWFPELLTFSLKVTQF